VKVALICQNFPPEFEGGTERVTLALARALRDAGDEVVVITGSDRWHAGRDVLAEDGLGVPVRRVPRKTDEGYGLRVERPRVLAVVEGLLAEHGTDVVHLQHWWTLSVRVLRAARARGMAAGLTLHDLWVSCPRFFRRPPDGIECPTGDGREPCAPCVKRDLAPVPTWGLRVGIADRDREIRSELAVAQFVTAPSRACAAATASTVPWSGPIEIVPHGLLEPARGARERRGPHAPFRVGTFGNLVREKGILVLVEAMAGVGGAELHLHGRFLDEAFATEVRARAAALGVALHSHGPYRAADLHPARELDLAVFPSLCEETYGLVVEEALARGVPVVVSDLGALAERIGAGGLVARAGDAVALRAALREVVASPERWERLRAGIPGSFSTIRDAAARYRELYRCALEARRP
jgi:glycosyltransferase involved in cell wall biosynthesis